MIDLQFQRGLQRLSAIPKEQRAIPDAAPLVSGLAEAEGQRTLQALRTDTMRREAEAGLADARSDQRLAGRDAALGLGVAAGGMGLSALSAHERSLQARQAELDAKYTQDLIDALRVTIKQYPDEIEARFAGTHPSQQAQEPTVAPLPQTFGRGEIVPAAPASYGNYDFGRGRG